VSTATASRRISPSKSADLVRFSQFVIEEEAAAQPRCGFVGASGVAAVPKSCVRQWPPGHAGRQAVASAIGIQHQGLLEQGHHLVTRVKSNAVAEPPRRTDQRQAEEGGTQALRQKDKAQVAVFRYPSNEDKLNGCSSEADYRRFVRAPVKGRASVAAAFDAVAVDTNNINAITVVATRIDLPSANTPFTPRSSTTTHKVICHRTTQLRCSRPVLL
jgi:hypothetical protein